MTVRTFNRKKFLFFTYVFWVALILTRSLNQAAVAQQTSEPPVKGAAVTNGEKPESTPTPAEFRPPPFQQLRYLEDYSYLHDKSLRREPFDRFKYLELREGKPDWYLSIGGEVRQRYEAFRNDSWGRAPDDHNGYLLQRYMLHTDWHFGKSVRAFVQLRSNFEAGRVGGPRPVVDENKLDFNQAFVDLSFGAGEKAKVLLRVGRQEMAFGTGRLVTFRESPNVRLSFDGLRATVKTSKWTIDGIAVKPVESDLGYFDDGPTRQTSFWGVGGQRTMNLPGQSKLGVFYLGLDRKSARFDAGTGREIRQTVGTQFFGNAGAVDHNTEFVYQFGSFKGGSIRAWMITTDTGYTFRRERLTPRVGLRANIASGDKNPNDNQLESFNALFPAGNYFGEIGLLGQINFMNLYPRVEFKMPHRISLTLETMFYWRQSTRDGIYNPAGVLLRPGNLSAERYVGTQPAVISSWAFDRHFTFFVSYSHFFSGKFLKETPPGEDIDYFTAMMTYRF